MTFSYKLVLLLFFCIVVYSISTKFSTRMQPKTFEPNIRVYKFITLSLFLSSVYYALYKKNLLSYKKNLLSYKKNLLSPPVCEYEPTSTVTQVPIPNNELLDTVCSTLPIVAPIVLQMSAMYTIWICAESGLNTVKEQSKNFVEQAKNSVKELVNQNPVLQNFLNITQKFKDEIVAVDDATSDVKSLCSAGLNTVQNLTNPISNMISFLGPYYKTILSFNEDLREMPYWYYSFNFIFFIVFAISILFMVDCNHQKVGRLLVRAGKAAIINKKGTGGTAVLIFALACYVPTKAMLSLCILSIILAFYYMKWSDLREHHLNLKDSQNKEVKTLKDSQNKDGKATEYDSSVTKSEDYETLISHFFVTG